MTHRLRRSLTVSLALLTCAFANAALTPEQLPKNLGPNLALGKPYFSSDINKHGWEPGLTNGSWVTDKANTYASGNTNEFPKGVVIDLEKTQEISSIFVGTPNFGSTKTVVIATSENGKKYKDVGRHDFELGKNDNHLYKFKPVKARYVRLMFTGNHSERAGAYSQAFCFITEVEVFGTSGGPTQSGLAADQKPPPPKADPKKELPRGRLPSGLVMNLALGKPYTCDAPNPSNWETGLNDGLWAMRRGATFATDRAKKFPKNVTIDLNTSAKLTHVRVGVPNFGSTKTIAVSVSYDGVNYTEVGRHDFPLGKAEAHLFEFAPTLARHVRLSYLGNHSEKVGNYDPAFCFTTEVEAYAQTER
ncbi:hypothetical protein M2103_000220 [Ereboglobus sp. PH5-5]|uniref:discoidin domain-containing protein n=1 Tax=Ereboglobus sp. PH5-5 TaxID=2940529 RepID=UPI002405CD75|nr:discoidin domain-containing protein [Ereboglobus sp. PH5-5]MDF9832016.1 hypothetical protein [Ereboglobus sp. PH5-5]